jgi:hypothetical protein
LSNQILEYAKENIEWVLKDVNVIKGVFDKEYFIYLCNLIAIKNPRDMNHERSKAS